ncbi:hypothetical protein G6F50_018456 [Rhizopus delemar]|uniref:Uncharacterized protein n=1 Tax=Rhizopus delemar TaxID=936053 RepID=A0A9P7BYR6_9FUNG|nr:hypothetical protein G6F50_018456 [Rhizopus delemar]
MPNKVSASTKVRAAAGDRPSSTDSMPLEPVQSRCHNAWPGSAGQAGWNRRTVSGRLLKNSHTCNAWRACWAMRMGMVRTPRSASQASSALME